MKRIDRYGFDCDAYCNDCGAGLGGSRDGSASYREDRRRIRMNAARHVRQTGHRVEIIDTFSSHYGPDR